jgi:hypothetical protein
MERFFDFIFGIRWWQWLLGMGSLAGLYYLVAGVVLPYFRRLQMLRIAEAEQEQQDKEAEEKQQARQEWEAARREHLKKLPSGPVGPVELPAAMVRVRHRAIAVPSDAETTFGTKRGVSVQVMARGVSREHAKIRPEPRGYVLYDLMSQAGTFLGDERIESKVLADGDTFRLGPVEVLFKLGEAPKDA